MSIRNFFLAFTILFLFAACAPSEQSSEASTAATEPVKEVKKWKVSTTVDSFTKASKSTAMLDSDNLQPVGTSGSKISASIVIWKKAPPNSYPAKIYFSDSAMPLGMSQSGSCYTICKILVKFDDGPIKSYVVYEPSSTSTSHQIFVDSKDFVTNVLKAKKTEIRVAFYREGNGDFVFINEVPFAWEDAVEGK